MHYRKYLIVLLVIFIASINNVDAKEYINIECKKENEYQECILTADAIVPISAVEYTYSLPSSVTLIEFRKESIWEGDDENSVIALYSLEDHQGNVPLGSLILSSDKTITSEDIKTEKILFYGSNYEEIDLEALNSVKDLDKQEEKKQTNKNNIIYYVIIIIGIVTIGVSIIIYKKKGATK